jgi:hypothetical protein
MAKDLSLLEKSLVAELREFFILNDKDFFYHYNQESLLTAEQVDELVPGYITIVQDIVGLSAITEIGPPEGMMDTADSDGLIWYETSGGSK